MAQCKESRKTAEIDWDNFNLENYQRALNVGRKVLAAECRAKSPGKLVGSIVRFQVADGVAEYMVKSERPLRLIHLADGDAWQADPALILGLNLEDVRARIEIFRRLVRLFQQP